MENLLTPDIRLTLWSFFCIIIFIGIGFLILRVLVKIFRKKSPPLNILLFVSLLTASSGCSDFDSLKPDPVGNITKEFKLRDANVYEIYKFKNNALHFESETDLRNFLESMSKSREFGSLHDQTFINSYLTAVDESSRAQVKRIVEVVFNENTLITNYSGGNDIGRYGCCPGSGSGTFSQEYMPWNSINVTAKWDNNRIISFTSGLHGVTHGITWDQVDYMQEGERFTDGSFRVVLYYKESAYLFWEAVGKLWESNTQTAFVTIMPGKGGGGDGGNYGKVRGRISRKPWQN